MEAAEDRRVLGLTQPDSKAVSGWGRAGHKGRPQADLRPPSE